MAASNVFSDSSSSSSSSSKRKWNHDVFLSFRGKDTRKNFTDHLYTSLIQAGISTFRDNDIFKGENISLELLKAIHESRISIPVFSKGYASSRWCLDELAEIIKCKNTIGQIVIPLFYNVDPSDVRKQTGSYGEAFERFEEFKEEMDKLKKWRKALTEAAELDGWDLQNVANGCFLLEEGDLACGVEVKAPTPCCVEAKVLGFLGVGSESGVVGGSLSFARGGADAMGQVDLNRILLL
ncbi:disease resistance protein RPV1-like [Hevea brasiliensis]|uniref:disease resistance protein RPV1-like n=1 Tax=Hevea brasiliensis TaxID=3981 RepID=UPI0025F367FF|nr:disease resistance protein RPV1-like [Hevea brasiliensis]